MTIVVEINGGVVVAVHSDTPNIDVEVVDWDNIQRGDKPPKGIMMDSDIDDNLARCVSNKIFPFKLY